MKNSYPPIANLLFSGYTGLFYQLNSKIGIFTNAKLSAGFDDLTKGSSLAAISVALGVNYQFNNKP